jgi:putative hydrolase of the HAD superfamily
MASILQAPAEYFIQKWLESFRERTTGILPTPRANIEYLCQKLGVNASEARIERALQTRLNLTILAMIPKPGSVETIIQLKSDGYKIALISDCSSEAPMIWKDTPLAPLFDVTVFSCEAGMKKPDPRIYKIATDEMGVEPEHCLYVGDGSSRELTGALEVGMYPVLIRHPDESADAQYIEREDNWDGPRISYLREVLNLVK